MTTARMRALCGAVMTICLALLAVTAAAAQPLTAKHLAMRLVATSDSPRAGSSVTLAIDTRPEAGWHGYWRNPGDAGFPAAFYWSLPKGASVGVIEWPVPTTLLIAGLMNHVYEAPYAPLVGLRLPAGLAGGTRVPVRVRTSYLVCTSSLCVPEAQELALDLTIGDGARSADAARFDAWRRAIPKPLAAPAAFAVKDGALTLAIPYPAGASVEENVHFFPVTADAIDYAAPQRVTREGDRLLIATKGKGAGAIDGVLKIGAANGLMIHAAPGVVGVSGGDASGWSVALIAFAGAVLGGLILNVMPCVFPILSLKALGLARSGASEADARREALAYTAGVVLVCLALGGAILALRAGGASVGWAFQLQDPRMIALLMLLSAGIALNLAGLFEVPMPRFAGAGGTSGAFATGAVAAFVATPCTGPFMGAALGAALVLPWYAALCVFAGLGIGLALPFLAIGFVPTLRRRLPKPGGWMETFRRWLSVPMWLTAIALGWVLGRQAGVDGLTIALVGTLLLGLVLWLAGLRQGRGRSFGWGCATALVGIAALTSGLTANARSAGATQAAPADGFTEAKLAGLRAAGRPVFVYFTADWCLTCKVNEKAAIDTAGTRAAFARHKVATLVGDWTDGDPAMGRFIEAHNRAGVPLYLFYPAGGGEPRVLPQVLTPGMLEGLQ